MQLVEQVGPFSICSGRLGEMLMMQCADPNTLPAPSRLRQLGQSLSLSLSPSVSFIHPYPSFRFFFWLFKKKKEEGSIVRSFLIVLLLPLSIPHLKVILHVQHDHTHKPSMSSLWSFFLTIPSVALSEKGLLSERYAIELARNQKRWCSLSWCKSAGDIKADETTHQSLTGKIVQKMYHRLNMIFLLIIYIR